MSDTIISVENLGKRYRIRHNAGPAYMTLRDSLTYRAKRLFSRPATSAVAAPSQEDFWALKDVSFEVKRGDVVGIIGRNGAGKSTLLKILSRITEPTTGRVRLKGRVASLLEVGTGFHPELTGRENIFLNGAILGMSKVEIRAKFDEIVAFAEVEKFLDTPVKHYSSGMYVRLAFAVAAHLEPEILIVDEVLAVGDAAFQKKCIGKMQSVASRGRTILFVSHNMTAVSAICTHGIYIAAGRISSYGSTPEVMASYTSDCLIHQRAARESGTHLLDQVLLTSLNNTESGKGWTITLDFIFSAQPRTHDVGIDVVIRNNDFALAFAGSAYFNPVAIAPHTRHVQCVIGPLNYAVGHYEIDVHVSKPMREWIEDHPSCASFDIERQLNASRFFQLDSKRNIGLVIPDQRWSTPLDA